jgi:hypothetical protein
VAVAATAAADVLRELDPACDIAFYCHDATRRDEYREVYL